MATQISKRFFAWSAFVYVLFIMLTGCSPQISATENVSVSWQKAIEILNSGDVQAVHQTHGLQIMLVMKDGRQIKAIEPSIDAIFHEVKKCGLSCSDIRLATE